MALYLLDIISGGIKLEPNDLLEIRKNNFLRLRKLAEQQEKIVEEPDRMDEFLGLMSKRESLINEIETDAKKYDSLVKKRNKGNLMGKSRAINLEISEIIESIQELDKRIERFVIEGKQSILNDISRLRKGRKAVKSYGIKGYNNPRFLDSKG